jgi:hypothetical protein
MTSQSLFWEKFQSCYLEGVLTKESTNSTEKEVLDRILFGVRLQSSREGPGLQMRRLRITMDKVLKSHLGIVRTF